MRQIRELQEREKQLDSELAEIKQSFIAQQKQNVPALPPVPVEPKPVNIAPIPASAPKIQAVEEEKKN